MKLGVNVDHIATVRNARGGELPDPVHYALQAAMAGANGITVHLREDRRHIMDDDVVRIKALSPLPLNLEMAATDEMVEIACTIKPHSCCLVPEKREELTTEGGLDVQAHREIIHKTCRTLQQSGILVSLFIDPDASQVQAAYQAGADIVELHTGTYAEACEGSILPPGNTALVDLQKAASMAAQKSIEVHAGHGLNLQNLSAVAAIPEVSALNIGHALVSDSLFMGVEKTISRYQAAIQQARGA